MSDARDFLRSVWAGKEDDLYLLVWVLQTKQSAWFRTVDQAADYISMLPPGDDIYTGAGLAARDHGPYRRCEGTEIKGIAGIWADIDIASRAHAGKSLPG